MTYVYLLLTIIISIFYDKNIFSNAEPVCPYGFMNFNVTEQICIKFQKGETYMEKYKECKTNNSIQDILMKKEAFNIKFIQILMEHKIKSVWADYERSYEGGPFMILKSQKPKPIFMKGIQDCASIEYSSSLTIKPVNCNESIYNVCVVEPFDISSNPNRGPCKENFMYYPSPIPACLTETYTKGYKGFAEGTRDKIKSFCEKLGGNLLGKGRIYRQNITFSKSAIELPLSSISCNSLDDGTLCSGESKLLSLNASGKFNTRNKDFVYNATICEHPIDISKVELKLSVKEKEIVVFVNHIQENYRYSYQITKNDFSCFTDAKEYYPTKANVSNTREKNIFNVGYDGDGYYWCFITNNTYFESYESNRIFFIKDVKYALNVYVGSLKMEKFDTTKNLTVEEWKQSFSSQVKISKAASFLKDKGVSYKIFTKKVFHNGTIIFHLHAGSRMDYNLISNENVDYFKPFLYSEDVKNGFKALDFNSFSTYFNDDICKMDKKICYCTKIKEKSSSSSSIRIQQLKSDKGKCEIFAQKGYIEQATEDINDIKNNDFDKVKNIVDDIDTIGTFNRSSIVSNDLYKSLDKVIMKSIINSPNETMRTIGTDISVAAFKTRKENPILGIRVRKDINKMLNFDFLDQDQLRKVTEKETTDDEMLVEIPAIFPKETEAISTQIISNGENFEKSFHQNEFSLNSKIISVSANNSLDFSDGKYIYINLIPYKSELAPGEKKICVFMDMKKDEWSTKGCELIKPRYKRYDTCRCNHMTHFAQLIRSSSSNITEHHEKALTIITYMGITLSMIGLTSIALTAVIFERWRSQFTNKVYLNLSAAIALLYIVFLVDSFVDSNLENSKSCIVVGAFLHYGVLVSFCWMFITATRSYKKLVHVFDSNDTSHRLAKASIFGWVMPLVPVITLLIVDHENYLRKEHVSKDKLFCFPQKLGFWLSVFLPVLTIVAVNLVYYCLIINEIFIKTSVKHENNKEVLRRKFCASVLLFFLFGLTWMFGLLSEVSLFNSYMFCIFASLQGFIFFGFFILGNTTTKNMWLEIIYLNRFRYKSSSEGYFFHKNSSTLESSNSSKAKTKASSRNAKQDLKFSDNYE